MSRSTNGHGREMDLEDTGPEHVIRLLVMIIRMMCEAEGIDPTKTRIHIDQVEVGGGKKEPLVDMPLEKILLIAQQYS